MARIEWWDQSYAIPNWSLGLYQEFWNLGWGTIFEFTSIDATKTWWCHLFCHSFCNAARMGLAWAFICFFCPKSQRHSEHLKINVIEFAWKELRSKLNQTNKINLEKACCYYKFSQDWCTSKWLTNWYIHDHLEKRSTIPQCYPCLNAILA